MHYAELFRWTAYAGFAAFALTWPRAGFWALPAGRLFVVARVRTTGGFPVVAVP